jgi:hypothetical protein
MTLMNESRRVVVGSSVIVSLLLSFAASQQM